MTLENVIGTHQNAGVDKMVISSPVHYIKGLPDAEGFRGIQRWDEYSAEVAQRYPDETFCFATTVPGGGNHYVKELERAAIEMALTENQGDVLAAARQLKVGKSTLYRKIKEYNLR